MIALSCKDLLLENGIKNITVSGIAGVAGIGKGTIYEYFSNKDEIVFEILNILAIRYFYAGLVINSSLDEINVNAEIERFVSFIFGKGELN